MFIEQRNYAYFMQLYGKHIEPVADTYAYCLLKNHFHLLVRLRDDPVPDPKGFQKPLGSGKRPAGSLGFMNCFTAYAKAINKAYGRTGSLFQHPFGRLEVHTERYLINLVRYIHLNPQKHRLVGDFREWTYSSYHQVLAPGNENGIVIRRLEVLEWFNGPANLIAAHERAVDEKVIAPLIADDFD